jgi:hypothetical protein
MLAQILPQLLSGPSRKHHVGYHQIDSALAFFVNLYGILRILGGQNFKACAFQNAARCLPHKRFVLNQ